MALKLLKELYCLKFYQNCLQLEKSGQPESRSNSRSVIVQKIIIQMINRTPNKITFNF